MRDGTAYKRKNTVLMFGNCGKVRTFALANAEVAQLIEH